MRKVLAAVTAPVMVAGAVLAASAATTAPASADSCQYRATCAFAHPNWGGHSYPVYGNNNDLTPYYGWTHAESIYNNGASCNVYIYSEKNRRGARYPLNRGTGWRSVRGSAIWHHAYSNQWYGRGC